MQGHGAFRMCKFNITLQLVAVALIGRWAGAVTIEKVVPAAVVPGKTTKLTIHGKQLSQLRRIWFSFPAKVKILSKPKNATRVVCSVTVPANVPVQLAGIRCISSQGVSNVRLILVDDLPSATKTEPDNTNRSKAATLTLPLAVDGQVPSEGSAWYRLKVSKPQRVSLEVFARRIGSPLDATLDVTDSSGRLLGTADDTIGLHNDCHFTFAAKQGTYFIAVRDSEHRGGSAYRFRLRCGNFPLVTSVFPFAIPVGKKTTVTALGDLNVPPIILHVPKPFSGQEVAFQIAGQQGSAFGRIAAVDRVEQLESEPNPSRQAADDLKVPGTLSARCDMPNDIDWYRIKVPTGQLRIRGLSRRYGVPTMLLMKLCNSAGKPIATSFTRPPQPAEIAHNITQAGVYYLRIEELLRRGDKQRYTYRLVTAMTKARFEIAADVDRLNIEPGKSTMVPLKVNRLGYNGSILVSVAGTKKLKIEGNRTIGRGKKAIQLKLVAAKDIRGDELLAIRFTGEGVRENLVDTQLLEAEKYNRGNLGIYEGQYISDKKGGLNYAEYDVSVPKKGRYRLELRFAAKASRPATLKVDGKVITKRIMAATTGGWTLKFQKWHVEQTLDLKQGKHLLRLERNGTFSHLDKLRISRLGKAKRTKEKIHATSTTTAALQKQFADLPYVPASLTRHVFVGVKSKSK